jgi:nucleoside transporter
MNSSVRFKLSVMMFLEFFIWGAWLPPSFGYFGKDGLDFTPWEQWILNSAFPISAIVAMFFASQFVDRNFSAEKYLAFSHFVGGLAMLGFGYMAWNWFHSQPDTLPAPGESAPHPEFWPYLACMAIHCIFYVPTISVTNAIAFASLKDAKEDFGKVRLWGTIGWIAASWPFVFILLDWAKVPTFEAAGGFVNWLGAALGTGLKGKQANEATSWAFLTAGIASLFLAAFSFLLPHTPPKKAHDAASSLAWLEAIRLLKHPYLVVLFVVTFIDAGVHDGFFIYAYTYLGKVGVPSNWIQPAMSVGQIAEIGTMAVLGMVLKRLGWRATMILGILGHAVRFSVFAFFPNPYAAVAVNVLHGICYAFFFATLYILVDEVFPKDARTSAQGLFNFLILGLGPIVARWVWPTLQTQYTVDGVIDYRHLLLYPAGAALFAAVFLALFFHPPKPAVTSDEHREAITVV